MKYHLLTLSWLWLLFLNGTIKYLYLFSRWQWRSYDNLAYYCDKWTGCNILSKILLSLFLFFVIWLNCKEFFNPFFSHKIGYHCIMHIVSCPIFNFQNSIMHASIPFRTKPYGTFKSCWKDHICKLNTQENHSKFNNFWL